MNHAYHDKSFRSTLLQALKALVDRVKPDQREQQAMKQPSRREGRDVEVDIVVRLGLGQYRRVSCVLLC